MKHMVDPELSIVVTSRNDNHGGNLLNRMQLFINGLLAQCQKYQLNAELIIIEWNPPVDKPRLIHALSWPTELDPCQVRIIEVSPDIHKRFKYSEQLPLFQMIGKNVGILRSRGQFILATNIDILFSNELIRFLASGRLQRGRMYRVDRYDVPENVPLETSLDAQLEYCRQHLLRVHSREGIRDFQSGHYQEVYPKLTWRLWLHEKRQDWGIAPVRNRCRLHTNACGDFTLMHREYWMAVRGYPEFEMYSMHIDSVLCYMAHHQGARETVLRSPMAIYHIEHGVGSGWTPGGEQDLNRRLKSAGIPQLDFDQVYHDWAVKMRRENQPIMFNKKDWGLVHADLPETRVS